MQALSLIDPPAKDPRNLAYLYPSMPLHAYKQRTDQYYKAITLAQVEQAARINGQILVPGICLNWSRKKKLADRQIILFRRAYYFIDADKMTATEKRKYAEICEQGVI